MPSHRRRVLAALTVLVAGLGATIAVTLPSASSAEAKTVRWTLARPACAQPADPAANRCFAERSVTVPAGTPGAQRAATGGTGVGGGFSPADLARVYGYNRNSPTTQTVAVINWYDDPYALYDLNQFNRHYGFPAETSTSFRKVNQRGASAPLPRREPSAEGAVESALDVAAVRAVCAHCRILLVEANSPYDSDLAVAVTTAARPGATEISNSWGGPEGGESSAIQAAMNQPGRVVTVATGDSGWYGWDVANVNDPDNPPEEAPSFPATSPYVIAVGGTSVTLGSSGTRARETVWNNNGPGDYYGYTHYQSGGASGGGCSRVHPAPYWQSHQAGFPQVGCGTHRLGTDVAAFADPNPGFSVYLHDGRNRPLWMNVGGTSLAAPMVAAMYALAGGPGGSEYPGASMYVNAARSAASRYDVVDGANGFCGQDANHVSITTTACAKAVSGYDDRFTNPNAFADSYVDCSFARRGYAVPPGRSHQCTATAGFDGPSGLGAPTSTSLFRNTSPAAAANVPSSARHGARVAMTATLRPISGTRITSVSWNFGDGTGAPDAGASVAHIWSRAGRYTVTMVARDSLGQQVLRRAAIGVG